MVMAAKTNEFGFVECADLINGQKYGAALKTFQQAVANFLDSKTSPKRNEIARQLFQIGSSLEETLRNAFGDKFRNSPTTVNCSPVPFAARTKTKWAN
jgi:hypothetical protein